MERSRIKEGNLTRPATRISETVEIVAETVYPKLFK